MNEPVYAAHDRIAARRASFPEGTWQRQTIELYAQLASHILQVYPDQGQLRSAALRKLGESLNDILDHDVLVRSHHRPPSPSPSLTYPYQASGYGA